jgi:hypothetical protein
MFLRLPLFLMPKPYNENDIDDSAIVEAFYSYKQFVELVDDFVKALHEAETHFDFKKVRPDNTCITFRIHAEKNICISILDGEPVLPCIGIIIHKIGVINESN